MARSNIKTRVWQNWSRGPLLTGIDRMTYSDEGDVYAATNLHVRPDGRLMLRPMFGAYDGVVHNYSAYSGASVAACGIFAFGAGAGSDNVYLGLMSQQTTSTKPSEGEVWRVQADTSAMGFQVDAAAQQGSPISPGSEITINPTIWHSAGTSKTALNYINKTDFDRAGDRLYVAAGFRWTTAGAQTIVTPTPASGSDKCCIHNDRRYVYGSGTTPQRVGYSDPADYETFTSASQYFDVGENVSGVGTEVLGLYSTTNALLICMTDGNWYALTGDPETGSLRKIGEGPRPQWSGAAVVYNNQVLFFGPESMVSVTSQGIDTMSFRAVTPYISSNDSDPNFGGYMQFGRAIYCELTDTVILPYRSGQTETWWVEMTAGVWTRHKMGSSEDDITTYSGIFTDQAGYGDMVYGLFFDDDNEVSYVLARPSRYYYPGYINEGTTNATPITGTLELAPIRSSVNMESRVRHITLRGELFTAGNTNGFHVFGQADETIACTVNGNTVNAITTPSGAGVYTMQFDNVAADFSDTLNIKFTGICSTVIDSIEVIYEEREEKRV